MKDYSQGLFFNNSEEMDKAIEILKQQGIDCVSQSCYSASLITEIENQMENNDMTVTTENIEKAIGLAQDYDLWDSLEECAESIVDKL